MTGPENDDIKHYDEEDYEKCGAITNNQVKEQWFCLTTMTELNGFIAIVYVSENLLMENGNVLAAESLGKIWVAQNQSLIQKLFNHLQS